MTASAQPNILDFDDYRDFLAARFRYLKTVKKNFSYAIAARRTNVAQSYYKNLFRKDRHVSLENLGRVSKALELNFTEEFYLLFKLISLMSQDSRIWEICQKNIAALRTEIRLQNKNDTVIPKNHLEIDASLNPLYFYVILYLCDWPDFKPTVSWVRERLFANELSDQDLTRHIRKAQELHEALQAEKVKLTDFRVAPLAAGQIVRTKRLYHSILPEILHMEDYHSRVHNYAEHRQLMNLSDEGVKEVVELFHETRDKLLRIQKKYETVPPTRTLFCSHLVYNLAREKDKTP